MYHTRHKKSMIAWLAESKIVLLPIAQGQTKHGKLPLHFCRHCHYFGCYDRWFVLESRFTGRTPVWSAVWGSVRWSKLGCLPFSGRFLQTCFSKLELKIVGLAPDLHDLPCILHVSQFHWVLVMWMVLRTVTANLYTIVFRRSLGNH